jgi:hypothetical protein
MRQTFAVATGEKDIDADATNPGAFDLDPPKPAPKPVAKPVEKPVDLPGEEGDWNMVEQIFIQFIPTAKTYDELKEFWNADSNANALNHLKAGSPDQYARVVEAFKVRAKELKG